MRLGLAMRREGVGDGRRVETEVVSFIHYRIGTYL